MIDETARAAPRDDMRKMRVREILCERFPHCFAPKGGHKRPLKIGIANDILMALPDLSPADITAGLADYTWGPTYCRQCVVGAARIDLDGKPCGQVTEKEAAHMAARLQMFDRQKRRAAAPATADAH